ncbi:hypothetical protein EMIT0P291_120039 [Pseudomonas sp. IT-P291]
MCKGCFTDKLQRQAACLSNSDQRIITALFRHAKQMKERNTFSSRLTFRERSLIESFCCFLPKDGAKYLPFFPFQRSPLCPWVNVNLRGSSAV